MRRMQLTPEAATAQLTGLIRKAHHDQFSVYKLTSEHFFADVNALLEGQADLEESLIAVFDDPRSSQALKQRLGWLFDLYKTDFGPLSRSAVVVRSTLVQKLSEILEKIKAIDVLKEVCENTFSGRTITTAAEARTFLLEYNTPRRQSQAFLWAADESLTQKVSIMNAFEEQIFISGDENSLEDHHNEVFSMLEFLVSQIRDLHYTEEFAQRIIYVAMQFGFEFEISSGGSFDILLPESMSDLVLPAPTEGYTNV